MSASQFKSIEAYFASVDSAKAKKASNQSPPPELIAVIRQMAMSYKYHIHHYDNWLEPWLARFNAHKGAALDVGCGPGLDTQFLAAHGFEVKACDASAEALVQSGGLNPAVPHALADARELLPYPDSTFAVVVAGLSLHYFDRSDSLRAFAAVHRVLKPGGLFLFRLNAWDDFAFGAPQTFDAWRVVEGADGATKQFFTEAMIREATAGRFDVVGIEKKKSERYSKPKSFFECCALKPDQRSKTTPGNCT